MEKKTMFALLGVAVLAALAYFMLRAPEKTERPGQKSAPVAAFAPDQIASFEVVQPGGQEKVSLLRKDKGWQVVYPYNKPAQPELIKAALEGFQKIKWEDITSENPDGFSDLGVTDDKALHIVVKDAANTVLADLYLGNLLGSNLFVRLGNKAQVWYTNGLSKDVFPKDAKTWRDHHIFHVDANQAERIKIVTNGEGWIALERSATEKSKDGSVPDLNENWKPTAAWEGKPTQLALDSKAIEHLVQKMSTLMTSDFVDEPSDAIKKPFLADLATHDKNTDGPSVRETHTLLSLSLKDGTKAELMIGKPQQGVYTAMRLDTKQFFSLKQGDMGALTYLPLDVFDKTLVSLSDGETKQIAIEHAKDRLVLKKVQDTWQAEGVANADESAVKRLVQSFANVKGQRFLAKKDAAAWNSLQSPTSVVTITPQNGKAIVLKIGALVEDNVPVQKVGDVHALWVSQAQVNQWLKKASDLVAPPVPAQKMMPSQMMIPQE